LLFGVSRRFADQLMTKAITLGTTIAALAAMVYIWGEPTTKLFNGMLAADQFSNLFNGIFLVVTGLVALTSFSYLKRQDIEHPEYYSLLLFACMGMMLLASALDLIVMFVALEIMSIAVYVLVGFKRVDVKSNEAALKYFILGSAASAVFLYGVALLYGATGTMNITQLVVAAKTSTGNGLMILGGVFVLGGFFFKVAAVPFHMWMPDVYEGAPTTITNFMTTGLKAAAVAAMLRVFAAMGYLDEAHGAEAALYRHILWVVALLTMFVGNVVALTQPNIKRMLAYSSISHTGYILVGILAGALGHSGYGPVVMYITTYARSNLGAFAVVTYLAGKGDSLVDVQDLAGLGFKRPALGVAMLVFMLSMAGVPPTAGFIGKYMMFSAAVQAGEVWLTILAVLCSAISAYYYLRIIVMMYMKDPIRDFGTEGLAGPGAVAVVAALATVGIGLLPSQLIDIAVTAAAQITGL
jgi:NADH-quinone oxidoreductase subunit N